MNLSLLFALLAIIAFLLATVGVDQGKGIPVGLIFLTVALLFVR